ncbi:hypothetical protein N7454_002339 [Penicillium verhagenii]|nr:hypothetical protein N7454_002339 [Penicillium verhagenii]
MAQTSPKPATVCAEHIAISHFFSLIPAPVVRNAIGQPLYPQKGKDYILPFSKERGLTELLAFLAKVDDGPDHIPAVCVEQNRAGTVLEVILAINKKSYTSGEEVIKELKQGFEKLFHILNEAQYEPNLKVTDKFGVQKEIFTSIVLMCSRRIICRLRLEPNAEKMPIQALLKQALFSIGQIDTLKLERKGLLVTSLSFIAEANKVIKLVDHWLLRHRTQEGLEDIVEGLNHLRQTVPQLHDLLDQILNKDMAPSSRSSLMNIIRKVSRYSEATRKLYRMAKKFPLVRNMKIQLASLPEKAFQAQANVSELPDLSSCLSKLGFLKGKKQTVTQLCHNLKLDEKAARARYELARMACAKTKIHAEIQVIAFCEMRAPDLFPRVISSSKDACFLCNRFIEIYGRMHTPRTHGRLYPGWRLPSLPQFGVFQQKLNASLLESLRQDVAHGLAQGKLQVYPTPNESNILTMSVSETTISMPTLGSDRSEGDGSSIGSSIALSDDTAKTTVKQYAFFS